MWEGITHSGYALERSRQGQRNDAAEREGKTAEREGTTAERSASGRGGDKLKSPKGEAGGNKDSLPVVINQREDTEDTGRCSWASQVAEMVKNPPCSQRT